MWLRPLNRFFNAYGAAANHSDTLDYVQHIVRGGILPARGLIAAALITESGRLYLRVQGRRLWKRSRHRPSARAGSGAELSPGLPRVSLGEFLPDTSESLILRLQPVRPVPPGPRLARTPPRPRVADREYGPRSFPGLILTFHRSGTTMMLRTTRGTKDLPIRTTQCAGRWATFSSASARQTPSGRTLSGEFVPSVTFSEAHSHYQDAHSASRY